MTLENERLATLEQRIIHLERQQDKMASQVDEMHGVLLQAKGAKWIIIAVASLSGLIASWLPFLIHRA